MYFPLNAEVSKLEIIISTALANSEFPATGCGWDFWNTF